MEHPPIPSRHGLWLRLRRYLIVFDPLTFVLPNRRCRGMLESLVSCLSCESARCVLVLVRCLFQRIAVQTRDPLVHKKKKYLISVHASWVTATQRGQRKDIPPLENHERDLAE